MRRLGSEAVGVDSRVKRLPSPLTSSNGCTDMAELMAAAVAATVHHRSVTTPDPPSLLRRSASYARPLCAIASVVRPVANNALSRL